MQHQFKSNSLAISINSLGAELCSVKNNSGLEFIWQANKQVWARHAPVLFPIVGKLKDNFYIYKRKKFELSQHGFARDQEFELISKTETECTFQLKPEAKNKSIYPFDFVFQIHYQLKNNQLTINYKVLNPSNEIVYFSAGAHPGFNCPLLPSEKLEDYYLEFEKKEFLLTQLNNGLRIDAKKPLHLKENKLFLNKELFENDALVFENHQINHVKLCSLKSDYSIQLVCNDWPYFGIWAKNGDCNFVCLEPWYGIADKENSNNDLLKKEGIIELAPQTEFNANFSLIFH